MDNILKYQFIEVLAQWQGGVNAKHLEKHFKISRPTADQVFKKYQANHPNNFYEFCRKLNLYPTSDNFQPHYTQGDLAEYVRFFGSEQHITSPASVEEPYLTFLPAPIRNVNPKLIRSIIKACKEQKRLDIGYYSVTSGITESRIISPHTIVNDGIRWHVRAWCERSSMFKDFVLSRFHDDPVFEDTPAAHTKQQDTNWNKIVELVIQPDPRLQANQQKAIELDYKMEAGRLVIPCRAALINYLIQRLRLDLYKQNPEGQQIIVEPQCWQELASYRL
ncbi:WYL domain-containing protein [Flocculibacter collagenilyticus]|uniref:WYL domain-containing protein n=1 Tax=Flocculibacter collagenilyticus TaxID=2744479 RepID=UPI0018F4D3E0|nr:WYL domain-containing protein [Flocculibacter collagenilyticus]